MIKRVYVIEDHPTVADGTILILKQMDNIEFVGWSRTGAVGIEQVQVLKPDMVLLDLNLPDMHGKEIVKRIKQFDASIHVVILTVNDYEDIINSMVAVGVSGILHKSADSKRVRRLIEDVFDGYTNLPIPVFLSLRFEEESYNPFLAESLTADEEQLLELISKGYTNTEIAQITHKGLSTVETHLSRIYKKLQLKRGRSEAIEFYQKRKLSVK